MQNFVQSIVKQECIENDSGQLVKVQEKSEEPILQKKSAKGKKYFTGPWLQEEQLAYYSFLKENIEILKASKLRRHFRVFKKMSDKIRTRGTIQCKSHHQKMMMSHGYTIEKVLAYVWTKFAADSQTNSSMEDGVKIEPHDPFYLIQLLGPQFKITIKEGSIQTY